MTLSARTVSDFSRPPPHLLQQQADWLAPARARLLRRIHVARRRRVLDLACGSGAVTGELLRRCGGRVVALDRDLAALRQCAAGSTTACADAARLPFAECSFDLVFCQFALMWMDAATVLREIRRVLAPGGALIALEPDYGGMIEHPPQLATRELWLAALRRAGADPQIGRKLPGLLASAGFQYQIDMLDRLSSPSPLRFECLRGLPLSAEEEESLRRIEAAEAACAEAARVAHLPMFLVTACDPTGSLRCL
jgi:SAM-dependent methyltransferase